MGASGGLLTIWNGSIFDGSIVQMNSYAITVKLICRLDNKIFHVTNIYGPANPAQKLGFVNWLMNLDSFEFDDWALGGDFNLIRNPENRNKPGGDTGEMNMFIPFSGRNLSWSNMQADPLLVKLDWVFTNSSWTLSHPATFVQPLSRPISDHIPYVLHIGTHIPKGRMFRFENFWVEHPGFMDIVKLHWDNSPVYANAAENRSSKLKQVRSGQRKWSKSLSNLNKLIYCN